VTAAGRGRGPLDGVQHLAVGGIANGVHGHLEPRAVGREDERVHLGAWNALDAARGRVVRVRLQHERRAGTQRAVRIPLEEPGAHPGIAGSSAHAALFQRAYHFHRERQPAVDAHREPALGAERAIDLELRRRDLALHTGDAGARGQVERGEDPPAHLLGARRMTELVVKYGAKTVNLAFEAILDHGERTTRQAIREAPDGEWSATGAMDNNGITPEPVPIKVTVRINGDEVTIDTTGSARQQTGPTNAPFTATVAFSRLALKRLTTPNFDANEGCFRALNVVAPEGTIFNAIPPAPVFQYGQHAAVMGELLMTALSEAMPASVVARSGGSECAFLFSGNDPRCGGYFAGAAIDGVGQGASRDGDGESALIVYFGGDGRNLPVEVLEDRFPILTLRSAPRSWCRPRRTHAGSYPLLHTPAVSSPCMAQRQG